MKFLRLVLGLFALGWASGSAGAAVIALARSPADLSLEDSLQLIARQRATVQRLFAPAEASARLLVQGGRYYLAGDRTWTDEGCERASGTAAAATLTDPALVHQGDVVWFGASAPWTPELTHFAAVLEAKKCLVIYFGAEAPAAAKAQARWVDNLVPPGSDPETGLLGNLLSLWAATAELATAGARHGRSLVFLQSHVVWGATAREALDRGQTWHSNFPRIRPGPAGVLSRAYLVEIARLAEGLRPAALGQISALGAELAARRDAGRPAVFMANGGHIMPTVLATPTALYHYMSGAEAAGGFPPGALVVFFGYVSVPLDLWREVRTAHAHAVWIVTPLPTDVDFAPFGDRVIDQGWRIGDGAVVVPGYDMRILPPSGVMELVIHRALLAAANPP